MRARDASDLPRVRSLDPCLSQPRAEQLPARCRRCSWRLCRRRARFRGSPSGSGCSCGGSLLLIAVVCAAASTRKRSPVAAPVRLLAQRLAPLRTRLAMLSVPPRLSASNDCARPQITHYADIVRLRPPLRPRRQILPSHRDHAAPRSWGRSISCSGARASDDGSSSPTPRRGVTVSHGRVVLVDCESGRARDRRPQPARDAASTDWNGQLGPRQVREAAGRRSSPSRTRRPHR